MAGKPKYEKLNEVVEEILQQPNVESKITDIEKELKEIEEG